MDPARLLRFHRARLRPGDAPLLRPGTALGQRGIGRALDLVNAALAVLVAPECLACHAALEAPLSGPVCPACWQTVRPLVHVCRRCGDPLTLTSTDTADAPGPPRDCERCTTRPPTVTLSRAAGAYAGTLRTAIHALKYDGRRSLARPLAQLMLDHAGEVLQGADLLVPVPLHRARHRSRGFNQSADLAHRLGPPVASLLARVEATRPQAELDEHEREANVRQAFAASRQAHAARGRVIVLVDDVSTTGATLDACARALRAAGAAEVRAITAARAVRGRP